MKYKQQQRWFIVRMWIEGELFQIMKKIIFICFIAIFSCNTFKNTEASKAFILLINKKKALENTSLQYNGIYSQKLKKGEKKNIQSPIYFFKNGVVLYDLNVIGDSNDYANSIESRSLVNLSDGKNWGTYDVVDGNIEAIIFCKKNTNREQLFKYYEFHFNGRISDNNTITNWRLVEPYAILNQKFNKGIVEQYIVPQKLEFHLLPAKTKIDSNKAWVNEYRTMK
jgi:hypothetical protein